MKNIFIIISILFISSIAHGQKSNELFNGYLSPITQTSQSQVVIDNVTYNVFGFTGVFNNDLGQYDGSELSTITEDVFIAVTVDGSVYELRLNSVSGGSIVQGAAIDFSNELTALPSGAAAIYVKTPNKGYPASTAGLSVELREAIDNHFKLMLDNEAGGGGGLLGFTAVNGLNDNDNLLNPTVKLGGPLIENTSVYGDYDIELKSTFPVVGGNNINNRIFMNPGADTDNLRLEAYNEFGTLYTQIGLSPTGILISTPSISTLTAENGDVLKLTDANTGEVEYGKLALGDLSNVVLTDPVATDEVLKFDGTNWINGTVTGTGGIALTDLSATTAAPGTTSLTYDNTTGVFTYTPPNLSGYLTSEVDGSVTNEIQALSLAGNILSLSNGGGSVDLSALSSGGQITLTGGGITTISGAYPDFVITSTEVDGDITNEIQDLSITGNTLSLSSDLTTVDLSGYLDDQTVTLTGGGITSISGTYPNFTITSTEVDGSTTNEGLLSASTVISGTSARLTSNTGGGSNVDFTANTGIAISSSGGNNILFTNSAPDQTVSITGSGFNTVTGTYPNFTIDGAANIEDLSNVVLSTPSSGQVLKFDGTNWVNGTDNTGTVGGGVSSVNVTTGLSLSSTSTAEDVVIELGGAIAKDISITDVGARNITFDLDGSTILSSAGVQLGNATTSVITAPAYGAGNKTATALTKTESDYVLSLATDGTVTEILKSTLGGVSTLSIDNNSALLTVDGLSVDLSEAIDNKVNTLFTDGTNILSTYDDISNTLTVRTTDALTQIDAITFDNNVTDAVTSRIQYNADVGTFVAGAANNVPIKVGQDLVWYVKNNTLSTIPKGTAVMAVGADGNSGIMLIDEMVFDGSVDAKYFLGVTAEDITSTSSGTVISQGTLKGYDTSLIPAGTVLYGDPTTPGGFTITEPTGTNLKLPIANVLSQTNNGTIAIRVHTGLYMKDLHDVDVTALADNNILKYDAATTSWVTATDEVNDADADATNEIQDLSLTGNTLSLSEDATTVDLSTYLDDKNIVDNDLVMSGSGSIRNTTFTNNIYNLINENNKINIGYIDPVTFEGSYLSLNNASNNTSIYGTNIFLDGQVLFEDYGLGNKFLNGHTYLLGVTSEGYVVEVEGGNLEYISLTDLSVTENSASGGGSLSYNNTNGVFNYTPPDLSGYLTSDQTTASNGLTEVGNNIKLGGPLTETTIINTETSAFVIRDSDSPTSALSISTGNVQLKGYFYQYGGVTQLADYGLGNNKASDLSLTASDYLIGASTNGTLIEVPISSISGSSGISLTDLSVTQNAASGNGTLTYNNTNGVFSYTPPNLSSYLTSEVDGSITNEIQDLSLITNTLSLSGDATTVDLSLYLDDQTVTLTGAGISAVTGTYPNFTITSTEVDGSVTNEIQSLSLTGDNLSLSDGGGTVSLPYLRKVLTGSTSVLIPDGGSLSFWNLNTGTTGITIDDNVNTLTYYGSNIYSSYGSGTNTGTLAYLAGFTSTGSLIEVNPYSGSNGLNLSGSNFKLGGTISENTIISLNDNSLSLGQVSTDQTYMRFQESTGDVHLRGNINLKNKDGFLYGTGYSEASDFSFIKSDYLASFSTGGNLIEVKANDVFTSYIVAGSGYAYSGGQIPLTESIIVGDQFHGINSYVDAYGKLIIEQGAHPIISTTTSTIDFESKAQSIVKYDLTSASATTSLTLSGAVSGGIYTIHFINATGKIIDWPANAYDETGSVKADDTIAGAGKMFTMYYDGTNYYVK